MPAFLQRDGPTSLGNFYAYLKRDLVVCFFFLMFSNSVGILWLGKAHPKVPGRNSTECLRVSPRGAEESCILGIRSKAHKYKACGYCVLIF